MKRSPRPTRRSLALLLPMLSAQASSQDTLPSRTYAFADLPVRENGKNRSRAVLNGKARNGFGIEMHHTELAPGMAPHAPHQHVHEEVVVVREGTIEVTINGKVSTLGPGGIAYVASNEHHGWRNIGRTQAHYLIITLGR